MLHAQVAHGVQGGGELPLAAIDDEQVGQRAPGLRLRVVVAVGRLLAIAFGGCGRPAEAALEHLGEHRIVVCPLNGADLEATVLLGARLAVEEDDHAADGVGALDVRDVVAFDAARRAR